MTALIAPATGTLAGLIAAGAILLAGLLITLHERNR